MKVTQEKLPASQVGLHIEISPEMSKQAYEKAIQQFTRSVNIPGFRRGKVPRQILIQQLGAVRIKASVVEDLIEEGIKQAIEQESIDAIGNFQLKSSFDDLVQQFQPGSALTFSAAVDVPPAVTLNQYKGLEVKAEEIAYQPEQVDEVLENYRNRSATLVPVESRAAQEKDIAVVDFSGQIVEENEEPKEIPGGSATDFEIELTEGRFIPGFVEGIIGMTSGETKELSVSFPDDYPQDDLAGKPAVFTITLKELKEKELPELDDDFAQEASEFETLAEWKESLETRFKEDTEKRTRSNKETALLNELINHIEVEIPETLLKRETDYMITQTAMQLSRQGIDIKQMFTPDLVERLRESSRDEAITRIKRTLALSKVAETESIEVDEAAVSAKITELMPQYPNPDEIDPERMREVVTEDLLKEKIFDFLLENNTVELVPEGTLAPPPEETDAEDEVDEVELTAEPETTELPADAVVEVEATTVESTSDTDSEASEAIAEKPAKTSKRKGKSAKAASSEES